MKDRDDFETPEEFDEYNEDMIDKVYDEVRDEELLSSKPRFKKLYVEAKKSRNFQAYTVGGEVLVDFDLDDEKLVEVTKTAQAFVRKRAIEQVEMDR